MIQLLKTQRTSIPHLLGKLLACAALMSFPAQAEDTSNTFRDCPTCPEMVTIPAGSFIMGANNGDVDERPLHRVTINSFAMGKTEITQTEWRAVMRDQSHTITGNDPSYFSSCGDNCPVEQVSWNDAQLFVQKLSAKTRKQYRLPSEAEWEYACKAGGQLQFCGSDNANDVAWFSTTPDPENSDIKSTTFVAGKAPNAFGLYDMSGNVWEWVADSYHNNYKGAPTDESPWQSDGKQRVLRGGSWFNQPPALRAASRYKEIPTFRSKFTGLRVVRQLP